MRRCTALVESSIAVYIVAGTIPRSLSCVGVGLGETCLLYPGGLLVKFAWIVTFFVYKRSARSSNNSCITRRVRCYTVFTICIVDVR